MIPGSLFLPTFRFGHEPGNAITNFFLAYKIYVNLVGHFPSQIKTLL